MVFYYTNTSQFIYLVYYKLTFEYSPVASITNYAAINTLCIGDTGIHSCGIARSVFFTYCL